MILYEQIESNKRKTVFLVIGFAIFVLCVGAAVTYVQIGDALVGLVIAAVVALLYTLIVLKSSTSIVMRMNNAVEISNSEEHAFIRNTVESLALAARIPKPKIFIIHDPSPNAFATGSSPKNGAVAVTTGLLERLNREEVEGVIAHEIAHIKNFDIRLATVAIALVSAVALLSDLGTRIMLSSRKNRSGNNKSNAILMIIALVFVLLSPLIATLIRLAISRNREYLADASGAELTRNPQALASALHKISQSNAPVRGATSTTAMLYISNPLKKKMAGMFSTHPPTDSRIQRLNQM